MMKAVQPGAEVVLVVESCEGPLEPNVCVLNKVNGRLGLQLLGSSESLGCRIGGFTADSSGEHPLYASM